MTTPVTIAKLDHTGQERFVYTGSLEHSSPDLVIARCLWDRLPPVAVGPLDIEVGDILLEYFYRDYWFNIFKVMDTQQGLKGWYCNVAETVELSATRVRWRDLALDLVVLPDGRQITLDEDEFAALRLDDVQNERALAALAALSSWASTSHPPFHIHSTGVISSR